MDKEEYEKFLTESADSEDILNILDDEMKTLMINIYLLKLRKMKNSKTHSTE